MATEPVPGPEASEVGGAARSSRANFWQRRYLLRHYRTCDDATLAAGSGLPEWAVTSFLQRRGAVRAGGDVKRIEKRGPRTPPDMLTPALARRAITKLQSRPLDRRDAVLIAGMFFGSLVLYAITCARTVTGEDAGEFLSAAHGFGVPHPPGYPLWLLLAWASDHAVNWVSTAWRVAMDSAFFSAMANAALLAVALKTLRSRIAAFTAAALFAVSLTHWTQAVIPEVYGLNTCFIALQVLLLVRLAEKPTAGRLVVLAAITGLSGANHTSAFPVGAIVAFGALLIAPQLFRRPFVVGGAILAGAAPLLLYFVLPLASAHHPYDDWGHTSQPGNLWRHVTRAQYAEVETEQQELTNSYGDYLERLQILAHWAGKQFGSPWVLLLAVLGIVVLFVRQTGLWLLLLVLGWLNSVGITKYTAFPFEREFIYAVQIFWIPAWLTLAWLIGGGLDVLIEWLGHVKAPVPRRVAAGLASAACLAIVGFPASTHFAVADRSRTTVIRDYGKDILDSMEPNALYFPSSDHSTFSVMYWQAVEHDRPDVTLADKYGRIEPELIDRFFTDADRQAENRLPGRDKRAFQEAVLVHRWPGPVYFANRRDSTDLDGRTLEPVGPIFKVMSQDQDEAKAWWTAPADGSPCPGLLAWNGCASLLDVDDRQRLDFTVQMIQGDVLYMRGFALLKAGHLDDALAAWKQIHGDLAPLKQAFNNIGAALADEKHLAEAESFFDKARQEDSRYLLGLRNEALVCKNRGDTAKAIDLLQQLVDADPRQREARLQLAELLDEANRPIEALAQYEALAAADEKDPAPWREAAGLLARRGDRKKAEEAFREVLRLVPGDQAASEGLAALTAPSYEADPGEALTAEADGADFAPQQGGVLPPLPAATPRGPIERRGTDARAGTAVPPR